MKKPSHPSRRREPLTNAQRAKAYRLRRKVEGLATVKCYLPADAMAYLGALCQIHDVTISKAVAMAVTHALRGDVLPSSVGDLPTTP